MGIRWTAHDGRNFRESRWNTEHINIYHNIPSSLMMSFVVMVTFDGNVGGCSNFGEKIGLKGQCCRLW